MTSAVTFDVVEARAASLYRRQCRAWAVGLLPEPRLEVPLHPPTEREVIADVEAAIGWVRAWRSIEEGRPVTVRWGSRRWSTVGGQDVPERVIVEGASAIAEVAGEAAAYARLRERCVTLLSDLVSLAAEKTAVESAVQHQAHAVARLSSADFDTARAVIVWLSANPVSGRRVRELPIRGIDTKWLEGHLNMVQDLVGAVTGRGGLGLRTRASLVRVRVLDPDAAIGGLLELAAPVEQLAGLEPPVATVLITENLETLLALHARPGVLAIHGSGYAVDRLSDLPWLRERRVLYWGDLDSHGLAILHQARSAGIDAQSIMMDVETLEAHRDLWVPEPQPVRSAPLMLTAGERDTYQALAANNFPRLEQERIPWERALVALDAALKTTGA